MFCRCKEEQKQNLYISEIKNKSYRKKGTICYFLAKKRYIFASGITSQDVRGVLALRKRKIFQSFGIDLCLDDTPLDLFAVDVVVTCRLQWLQPKRYAFVN